MSKDLLTSISANTSLPLFVFQTIPQNYRHTLEKGDLIQHVATLIFVTKSNFFSCLYAVGDPHFREDDEYIEGRWFELTKKLLSTNVFQTK
ncbi:hypothetical protein C9980_19560 [Vibrio mediterranei]|nr:hypothetical protein C9980_19560 [Vibrio mediterranei]